jgi:hypothetical protein
MYDFGSILGGTGGSENADFADGAGLGGFLFAHIRILINAPNFVL